MDRFAGKVVLVTGASSGIGLGLAREFAHEGADLVLAARRADRLAELKASVEATGRRALAVTADVTRDGDLENVVKEALERFGRLDVAVANAGFGVVGRLDRLQLEDYRRQLETNFFGVLRTIYATLPALKRTGGQIVVIGSVSGHVPTPDFSAYCASKAAVRSLCDSIHHELAADGVGVTLISPGIVTSEIRQLDNRGVRHEAVVDPVPTWLQMPAEKAARQIVDAAARRERERVITLHGKLAVLLHRCAPGLVHLGYRIARRLR